MNSKRHLVEVDLGATLSKRSSSCACTSRLQRRHPAAYRVCRIPQHLVARAHLLTSACESRSARCGPPRASNTTRARTWPAGRCAVPRGHTRAALGHRDIPPHVGQRQLLGRAKTKALFPRASARAAPTRHSVLVEAASTAASTSASSASLRAAGWRSTALRIPCRHRPRSVPQAVPRAACPRSPAMLPAQVFSCASETVSQRDFQPLVSLHLIRLHYDPDLRRTAQCLRLSLG